jgi:hypothetical protein
VISSDSMYCSFTSSLKPFAYLSIYTSSTETYCRFLGTSKLTPILSYSSLGTARPTLLLSPLPLPSSPFDLLPQLFPPPLPYPTASLGPLSLFSCTVLLPSHPSELHEHIIFFADRTTLCILCLVNSGRK